MITIKKGGLLTTVQDLGRYGYQKYGVVTSGAMDQLAHRIANLLVGNEEYLPTLEITLIGPTILFHEDTLIAICGANLSPTINDKAVRLWRTVLIKKGSELKFVKCKKGCRAYLAVAGGFSIPTVLKSKSTYLRAGFGGFKGSTLNMGDHLFFEKPSKLSTDMMAKLLERNSNEFVEEKWSVSSQFISIYNEYIPIRVIKGRQYHLFTKESQQQFFKEKFEVTPQSDRMGYRLRGPSLTLKNREEMISEAVGLGTIQVPADGNPIILLADRQTIGGYPKIADVVTVDIPLLAQAKPKDFIQFIEISHEEAQLLYIERERLLLQIKHGIKHKYE
ncbi:MAG TPA: biotin-dependent carboxyltransferase family protein [Bacillus bacterium]|nr:biotin-dependent carboxyltransferase family protein [Bacillus sp. (in: firmicutes)]